MRGIRALLGLAALLGAACAPVEPRPRFPAEALTMPAVPGSLEEAVEAQSWRVPRPTYLPAGAVLEGVDYSVRPEHQFVVQRYVLGPEIVVVISEWTPPIAASAVGTDSAPPPARELLLHGQPAVVIGVRGPDGGVGEWRVIWFENGLQHTVGGTIAAEELVKIATGLR